MNPVILHRPCFPWASCPLVVLAALGMLTLSTAYAFPPTPPHVIRGMVRTEMGDPFNSTNAVVTLETLTGVRVQTRVVPNMAAGRNYSLSVPMDAGTTADNYKATALRAASSFRMKVQIGAVTYLPLETAVNLGKLGKSTQMTTLDLTLGEDTDGDGLPDAWERALLASMGLNGMIRDIRPGDDSDGDGISNLNEYRAGTYAFDPADGFELKGVQQSADAVALEFLAIPGRTYAVQHSTDLKDWSATGFRLSSDAPTSALRQSLLATRTQLVRIQVPSEGLPDRALFRATVQ